MLELKDIHTYYGESHVLFGVSLTVKPGEAVALLGRNGVGKSTTIKSIMGLTPPKSGRISYLGQEIHQTPTRTRVDQGICYVPDNRRIFADLTVLENLEVADRGKRKSSRLRQGAGSDSLAGLQASKQGQVQAQHWTLEKVYELFPKLKMIGGRRGGYLSGGEQQMLAIARALLGNPELLILDEPTEGLAPLIVAELEEEILKLKSTGISILIAEQNLKSALRIADRCYVLEKGQVRFEGSVEELQTNEEIREKYLLV
jgi:branched-chain amino acid transport system ATP-binding protein